MIATGFPLPMDRTDIRGKGGERERETGRIGREVEEKSRKEDPASPALFFPLVFFPPLLPSPLFIPPSYCIYNALSV